MMTKGDDSTDSNTVQLFLSVFHQQSQNEGSGVLAAVIGPFHSSSGKFVKNSADSA